MPPISSILGLSASNAAIRSSQSTEGSSDWLSFGRMSWSEQSNQKWTTKYLGTESSVEFFDTEVWAPSWTQASKAPLDVYVRIDKDQPSLEDSAQGLVVAVRVDLASANEGALDKCVSQLRDSLKDCTLARLERPWGVRALIGYSNCLNDCRSADLAANA